MLRTVALAAVLGLAGSCLGDEPAEINHSFLATGAETYIVEFGSSADAAGRVTWRYPHGTRDGWVLPDGSILLAVNARTPNLPGGGIVHVMRDGSSRIRYKGTQSEVNSVQPLPDGGVVLTEAGPEPRLIELDAQDNIVVQFPLQCQRENHHMQTRMARKLGDGTYLVPHLFDFAVKQYDRTGKVLSVIDTTVPGDQKREIHSWPFTAIRLPNGHTLCGLTHASRVAEFDPAGQIVWQLTNEDLPPEMRINDACGVQRLPNGHTVITSYAGRETGVKLIEVTPDKKVVWSYRDGKKHGIHHFQILATRGQPLAGTPMK